VEQTGPGDNRALTLAERHGRLDHILKHRLSRRGWRLEFYSETAAMIIRGRPISHGLHGFLTLVTAGFWLLPWLWLIAFAGERREVIFVHSDGRPEIRQVR
jgi:hypothetical protein